jgi:hypothetical protein
MEGKRERGGKERGKERRGEETKKKKPCITSITTYLVF